MSKVTDIRNFDPNRYNKPFVNPNDEMRAKLRIGMSVTFSGNSGEVTDAVVVKINKKNIQVRTVQARRNAPAGGTWNVSPSLLTIVEGANFKPPTEREAKIQRIVAEMTKHNISLTDIKKAWG